MAASTVKRDSGNPRPPCTVATQRHHTNSGKRDPNSLIKITAAFLPAGLAKADAFNMPSGQTSLQFVTVGDPGSVADSVP